jgi:hypothetical protein
MFFYGRRVETMRRHRKAETHKPGTVTKVISGTAITDERVEIRVHGADPRHAKIRVVNFLSDGSALSQGDSVEVVFKSSDVESKTTD